VESQLRSGAEALGLALSDHQIRQLLDYAGLLQKWGRVYNLTARLGADEIVSHHLLDSLAVVKPLSRAALQPDAHVLDTGSGAGLPGVVLAITRPEIRIDCVDAVAKKAAFIQQVAGTLGLTNLRGLHSRVEELPGSYSLIASRAFASLGDFVRLTGGVLEPDGSWMAMKGKYPADEVAALPTNIEMFHVEQLEVPGLNAERCVVWMRRRAA
jgi:16S rRNA (guanine527-N7)-methyltransferase